MKKILLNLTMFLGAVNLFANVGIFSGSGTDLKLSESQELQMQSEIVKITALPSETLIDSKGRNRFWAQYECEFILKSLSDKDISTRVGFPLSGDDRFSDGAATIKNRDFKVYSQSFDIKDLNTYEVQYIPYDKENNFSHIFYWDMDFRANKAIKLRVFYKLAGYFGLASTLKRENRRNYRDFNFAPYQKLLLTTLAQSFNYVTRTGDTWVGEIESAKFIFDLGDFDKSLEKAFPFDLGETKTDPKYEKKQIEMNFLKNGQYYRTLDFQAALKDDSNLPSFEDNGDGLYIADIAPFKPTKGFATTYFFTAYPRDVEGLDYLMSGIERIYELNNEKLKTRKDFEPQVFTDKDKADLADIILEFYGISRNNEAIKDFLNCQSFYPSAHHPQIDEALKEKLLEISNKNKHFYNFYSKIMIAKKKFKAEFNEESFEALVKDSLKAREIPDKPLLGFAIYDKDDFTPTIITHELQAGENECALPYNMSFRGNFNAINSFITSFKLKSPAEKSAMEINILDLAIPKGFSTHTTAIPIAEGNRIVNIVIFTYDNSNRESLAKVNLALKSFEDENQNYEKLRDYFPDLELSEIEQRDFLFKALNSLLDNPKRPSLNYIWKRGLIVSYIKRLEKAFSQDEVGILFRGLKVRSAMLTMDADIVELLEEITGENTSYTLDYLKTYQGNDEADRLKRIQDWQFSYLNNKNKKR